MNTLSMLIAAMFLVLAGSANAADTPEVNPSSREKVETQLRQAQERLNQAAREMANLSMQLNSQLRHDAQGLRAMGRPHALLGINVGSSSTETAAGGTDARGGIGGVRIVSVSPGGPADVAGLRANDVITSFNGNELRNDADVPPRQQLLSLMRDIEMDAAVAVEFRRDGKTQKAQIVPKSLQAFMDESDLQGLDNLAFVYGARGSSGFGSAEFLELSPGLGRYFGTERGLLVVRAPKDERLKLLDGDVLLDIDGRVPTGPAHAYQILSSYRAGEVLKIHIMRQQKKIELPVEVPANAARTAPFPYGARLAGGI
jgi:S1-C subfamily serine protease